MIANTHFVSVYNECMIGGWRWFIIKFQYSHVGAGSDKLVRDIRHCGGYCAAGAGGSLVQCAGPEAIQGITEEALADLGHGHLQAGRVAADCPLHQRGHFSAAVQPP